MIVVQRMLTVLAAPNAVLAYLRDFTNTQHWIPATQRAHRHDVGPLAPGATWQSASKILGITTELTWTLITAEPYRLVFSGRNEGATCVDTITLGPVISGTQISLRVDLELHGLAKLITPVFKGEIEKLGTRSASGLAEVLNRLDPPHWHSTFPFPPPAPA